MCEVCYNLSCCCAEMARAKLALKGSAKKVAVVSEPDRLDGPFAFGPFSHMAEESSYAARRFVGPGGVAT